MALIAETTIAYWLTMVVVTNKKQHHTVMKRNLQVALYTTLHDQAEALIKHYCPNTPIGDISFTSYLEIGEYYIDQDNDSCWIYVKVSHVDYNNIDNGKPDLSFFKDRVEGYGHEITTCDRPFTVVFSVDFK